MGLHEFLTMKNKRIYKNKTNRYFFRSSTESLKDWRCYYIVSPNGDLTYIERNGYKSFRKFKNRDLGKIRIEEDDELIEVSLEEFVLIV